MFIWELRFSLNWLYLQGEVSFEWNHMLHLIFSYVICSTSCNFYYGNESRNHEYKVQHRSRNKCMWNGRQYVSLFLIFDLKVSTPRREETSNTTWSLLEFSAAFTNGKLPCYKVGKWEKWKEFTALYFKVQLMILWKRQLRITSSLHGGSNLTSVHLMLCYWKSVIQNNYQIFYPLSLQ